MLPIIRVIGGLVVKEAPAIVKYSGKRLLPQVASATAGSSTSLIRRTVGRRTKASMAASLKGATTVAAKPGLFKRIASKMPNWLKRSAIFVGEVIAFDELTDLMFGENAIGASGKSQEELEDNALANILVANGHSKLLDNIENIPENEDIAHSRVNDLTDLVSELFTSRNSICGADLAYSKQSRLDALTVNERSLILVRLISVVKHVCISSDDSELFLLMANQAMVSGMSNAAPTNAFDTIINSNAVDRRKAGLKAAELNAMFTALGDELAESAYDDFFSSHSSFFDFFDLISYDGDEETEGEDSSIAARIARLVTDDSAGAALSMIQRFAVDSDGKDDESKALSRTIEYSRLSNAFTDFIIGASLRNSSIMSNYLSK